MPVGLGWAESLPHLNSPLMPSLSLQLYSGTTVWVWGVWGSCAGGSAELFMWIFPTGLGSLSAGSEGLISSANRSTSKQESLGRREQGSGGGWTGKEGRMKRNRKGEVMARLSPETFNPFPLP